MAIQKSTNPHTRRNRDTVVERHKVVFAILGLISIAVFGPLTGCGKRSQLDSQNEQDFFLSQLPTLKITLRSEARGLALISEEITIEGTGIVTITDSRGTNTGTLSQDQILNLLIELQRNDLFSISSYGIMLDYLDHYSLEILNHPEEERISLSVQSENLFYAVEFYDLALFCAQFPKVQSAKNLSKSRRKIIDLIEPAIEVQ